METNPNLHPIVAEDVNANSEAYLPNELKKRTQNRKPQIQ